MGTSHMQWTYHNVSLTSVCSRKCWDYKLLPPGTTSWLMCIFVHIYKTSKFLHNCLGTERIQFNPQWVSVLFWASSWENLFLPYAHNKGADQHAQSDQHICCLFLICSCYVLNFKTLPSLCGCAGPVWVIPSRKPWRQVFSWRGSIKSLIVPFMNFFETT